MKSLLVYLKSIEDPRQKGKVIYDLYEVIYLVLCGVLANVEYWQELESFGIRYEKEFQKRGIFVESGIPSHDTIQRIFGFLNPQVTAELAVKWAMYLKQDSDDSFLNLINVDGKTIGGNKTRKQKALHMVSAYSHSHGICLAQAPTNDKSNEITKIPEILKWISLEDSIVTIDAMGTQTEIVKTIVKGEGQYCLAVKANQKDLLDDIQTYLDDPSIQQELKARGFYTSSIEKARGQIEKREYWITDDVTWLNERQKGWKDLNTIGMVRTTLIKEKQTSVETRYYISNLSPHVQQFAKAVRGHWGIESMHWLLDVVFLEDKDKTVDKVAAQHMNHLRKLALSLLKALDFSHLEKRVSYRRRKFLISLYFPEFLDQLFEL